ncbi:unnamed protein product [Calypogeia fissa]
MVDRLSSSATRGGNTNELSRPKLHLLRALPLLSSSRNSICSGVSFVESVQILVSESDVETGFTLFRMTCGCRLANLVSLWPACKW